MQGLKCLNLSDPHIKKLVKDFGEVRVSQLIENIKEDLTYDAFINNKEVKDKLGVIPISKTKEEIGLTLSKVISNQQLINLKSKISKLNDKKNGVIYKLFNIEQKGKADLYSWGLRKIKGDLNVDAKIARLENRADNSTTKLNTQIDTLKKNNNNQLDLFGDSNRAILNIKNDEDYSDTEYSQEDDYSSFSDFDTTTIEGQDSYDKFRRYQDSLSVADIIEETGFKSLDDVVSKLPTIEKALVSRAKKVNPGVKIELNEEYGGSQYDSDTNVISISLKEIYAMAKATGIPFNKQLEIFLTHEYVHAATERVLQTNKPIREEFEKLHKEFLQDSANRKFQDKLRNNFLDNGKTYQQDKLSEFIADFANPYFREYLDNLGMLDKVKNWFKKIINKIFGTNLNIKQSTLDKLADTLYSDKIDKAFNDIGEFDELQFEGVSRAVPENTEVEKEIEALTGKFKKQILALKRRVNHLINLRDKQKKDTPIWISLNNQIENLEEGLKNINEGNIGQIVFDLGKEVLDYADRYISSLEKKDELVDPDNIKYLNEVLRAFYSDVDTGDVTDLESRALRLIRRLDRFRIENTVKLVNEFDTSGEEITKEAIDEQDQDINILRTYTGALSDLANYLARTIGSIIKAAQNKVTVENKKVAQEISSEIELLKNWAKKNGVQEEDIYDIFIQESKGTLTLTRPKLDDNTINPNYTKIQNTPELKRFYEFHKKVVSEANEKLPVELGNDFIANVQRSLSENLEEEGILNKLGALKDSAKQMLNVKQYDLKEPKNEDLYSDKLNLRYIKKLSPDEKSRDLGNSLLEYTKFANNYEVMSEVLPQVRLLQQEIASKEYRKNTNPGVAVQGKNSNLYRIVDDYIKMQVKGISKNEGFKVPVGKDYDENGEVVSNKYVDSSEIIDIGLKYNSLLRIGLSPFNAVSNVIIGQLGNTIEAIGSRYFSGKDLSKANKIFFKQVLNKDSDFNKAILELNPLQELEEYSIYKEVKLNKQTNTETLLEGAYKMQQWGELYLQGQTMIAILIHDGLMTPEGKFTEQWSNLSEKDKSQLSDKIQRLNQSIHGRYSSKDSAIASQYVIYRLISQFRKWIPAAIESRLGGRQRDNRLNKEIEGRYITFFNLVKNLQDTKKRLLSGELTELEIYNMKKNLFEIALIAGSILVYAGLKGDDDDKEFRKQPVVKFTLDMLNRVSGDLLFFYNPAEVNRLASRAIPLSKTVGDLLKVVEYLPYSFYDYDGKAIYKSGPRKGENKFYSRLGSVLPGFKPASDVYRLFNEEEFKEIVKQ